MMATSTALRIENALFGTTPGMLHANGPRPCLSTKWADFVRSCFVSPKQSIGQSKDITVITANNGHAEMGLFERSLEHMGVPVVVGGKGVGPWINGIHKPPAIIEALTKVQTKYVLYGDSRDVLLLASPDEMLDRYLQLFSCGRLLYGAETNCFPRSERLRDFEAAISGAGPFKYLNGGMWIGRAQDAYAWYREVMRVEPLPETSWSEQGLIRQLRYLKYHQEDCDVIALDHRCELFQNNVCSQAHEMWRVI